MSSQHYQQYLYLIGQLKDKFKLTIDVDREDIHTFFQGKRPLFKLFFGTHAEEDTPSIVVSFHLDLLHPEVIIWFNEIYELHPTLQLQDSYYEDSKGDAYLGEDALYIQDVARTQEVLSEWLTTSTREEIEEFATAPIQGNPDAALQAFRSPEGQDPAIIKFNNMVKPGSDDEVH